MSLARSGALLVLFIATWSMAHQARGQTTTSAAPIAIDAGQSSARFVVHTRISMRAEGLMPQVSGELLGSPDAGWQVLVYVDGRGLLFEGPRWMERITRSEAFLAVDRHPGIHFHSEKFADAALRDGGPLHGELTLARTDATGQLPASAIHLRPAGPGLRYPGPGDHQPACLRHERLPGAGQGRCRFPHSRAPAGGSAAVMKSTLRMLVVLLSLARARRVLACLAPGQDAGRGVRRTGAQPRGGLRRGVRARFAAARAGRCRLRGIHVDPAQAFASCCSITARIPCWRACT